MLNHTEVDLRKRMSEVQMKNGIPIWKPLSICISQKELQNQLATRLVALQEVFGDYSIEISLIQDNVDSIGLMINKEYLSKLQKTRDFLSNEINVCSHYLLVLTNNGEFKDINKVKNSINVLLSGSIFELDTFFII